jgi:integrase
VQYRVSGSIRSTTLFTHEDALEFAALVDKIGGEAARRVLVAREHAPAGHVTLAAYAAAYVDALEAVTDGTRKDYRGMVANRLAGTVLGELPITAVSREAVSGWLRDDVPGATKTKRNYHALVSATLAKAVEDGLIGNNPAAGVKIRQVEPVSADTFLSAGELAILVGAIPIHYQPLVIFLAGTGCRWGEATALTVGDVDLDARVPLLRVTKAWQRTGDGSTSLGPPKTRAGIRTVSLSPEVVSVIRPLCDGKRQDALVFTNPSGGRVRGSNFHTLVWQPTLKRLNDAGALTKHPRVHDLRHAHASTLVAAGVPLNVVQRRLGHEKITTTVDRYSHLAPDYLEVSAAAASLGLVQAVPELEA